MRRETGADPESAGAGRELERRLMLATPADSVRGMFFRSVLEVTRELGDTHAVERCVEACGERKFVDFHCYPASSFLRLLGTAARLLGTGYGTFDGALKALGRRGATDFFASATGRPLGSMLQGHPKRMVESLPMAYAVASANGGQCGVTWESPRRARVMLERDFFPCAYVEGGLTAALELLGARDPLVKARSMGPLCCEYSLTWV